MQEVKLRPPLCPTTTDTETEVNFIYFQVFYFTLK